MRQRGIPSLTLVSVFVRQGGGECTVFFLTSLDVQKREGNLRSGERKLSLPLQPPHVMALTCPKHCPYVSICSWHPLLQLYHSKSSEQCCPCRTLTVLPLSPSRPGQKQEAQKEQIKAEKSLTQHLKMPRGEKDEGWYPAMYSRCLNKGLPWVCAC